MVGLVFLCTQAGRPGEWAILLADTVLKLLASGSNCLACPRHKTSRTHGVVCIVSPCTDTCSVPTPLQKPWYPYSSSIESTKSTSHRSMKEVKPQSVDYSVLYRVPNAFLAAAHNSKHSMHTIATLGEPNRCLYSQPLNTYCHGGAIQYRIDCVLQCVLCVQ